MILKKKKVKKNFKIKRNKEVIEKKIYDDISIYKKRSKKKISMDDFSIPEYKNYMNIVELNYNVKQLKIICKEYNLKITGCKTQLKSRIFNYLKYEYMDLLGSLKIILILELLN